MAETLRAISCRSVVADVERERNSSDETERSRLPANGGGRNAVPAPPAADAAGGVRLFMTPSDGMQ